MSKKNLTKALLLTTSILVSSSVMANAPTYVISLGVESQNELVGSDILPQSARQVLSSAEDVVFDKNGESVLGPFEYTIEAEIVKEYYGDFLPDVKLVPVDQFPRESRKAISTLPSLFNTKGNKSSNNSLTNMKGIQAYEGLESLDRAGNKKEYRSALAQKRLVTEDSDPLAGYIDVNLGIIALLEGKLSEAEVYFQPLAKGDIHSSSAHRLMAMWRMAWIAHQRGDHLKAYQMYTETEEFADNFPRTVARTIKERTGLIMELAKDKNKGELWETREFVDANRSRISPDYWNDLATIDLMYVETFYYEEKHDEFLERVDLYLESVDQRATKQIATATIFKGVTEFNTGNITDAFITLESVLEIDLQEEDRWQSIPDIREHATKWLIEFSKRLEDEKLVSHYEDLLDKSEGVE